MQLKKLVQIMLVGGLLVLGGCARHHQPDGTNDSATVGDMNNANGGGVQTSGAGQADSFGGDQGGNGSYQKLSGKHTYYFDFDRSDVHDSDKPSIYALADYLVAHPHAKVILEGHTDPRGSREYNVALGERRANAVLDLLKSRGVNPDQIRVVSYGAERPAVPGRSEQDYQLDRRAVNLYLKK